MNHVHAVLERNADDIVLREVSGDRGKTLADLVGLISLESRVSYTAYSTDCGLQTF